MRICASVLPGLLLCVLASPAPAATEPEDYVQGWQLVTPGERAIYRLELPYGVLAASRHGLRDLAVFNARGEALTWWPEPAADPGEPPTRTLPLPVYPDDRVRRDPASGEIVVLQEAGRTAVRVRPGEAPVPVAATVAHVVVVPEDTPPLVALELEWSGGEGSYVAPVRISAAGDLADWQPAGGGALAELHNPDGVYRQQRVALHVPDARFYRIAWRDMPAGWQLEAVRGVQLAAEPAPRMEWRDFPVQARDGFLYVEPGATLHPLRANLDFTADNVLLDAVLEGRARPDAGWRHLEYGVFYRLRDDGALLRNPPLELDGSAVRELRLRPGTGRMEAVEAVGLAWVPPRIRFVASGPGPYLLAAGAARAEPMPRPPALETAVRERAPGIAQLASPVTLGGPAALEPDYEINAKTLLLWGLLIAGTLAVLLMVWRLARASNDI